MDKAPYPRAGRFEQTLDAILIRDLRAMNFGFDHQTFRIYQQLPLPATHLLGTIEAPLLSADAGRLHRLAVHDARARFGVPAEFLPQPPPHRPVHLLPGAIYPPRPEVVEHRLPRRELAREHAPLATTLQNVKDGVQDLSGAVDARASSSLWDREVRLQQRPFGVGEVRGVSVARHAADRTRSTAAFSDSLRRGILRSSDTGSCIASVLYCQNRPIAPHLSVEVITRCCGAA